VKAGRRIVQTGAETGAQTADLFAALHPVIAAAPVAAPAPVLAPPPSSLPLVPPQRRRRLWYAVVFAGAPDLYPLSLHALQFTSFVSLAAPNALLLEIQGSLRLFGSFVRLRELLDARWQALGLQAQSAVAPATLAALWCARIGEDLCSDEKTALTGRLLQLPLIATAWDPARLQTLRSMGIQRLGDLLRLPRAGLARRLGPAAVRDLDIALGKQPEPRRAFVPRERFRERLDFETEIEHVTYLERALEPLLERCARFLRRRQAGVQSLALRLRHRVRPATEVHLGFASVTSEQRRLAEVLAQRLNRLELPAAVRAIALVSGPLQPLSAVSLDAFGGGGRDTAVQLIERLRARLGEQAVYGVTTQTEHRPEAASCRVQQLSLAALSAHPTPPPFEAMPRPVWLLDAPVLLSQREVQELRLGSGGSPRDPERIETGWWDGKGVARDYYRVRPARGAELWVFQERHTKSWYLHGMFA
jgi:protein ImuB